MNVVSGSVVLFDIPTTVVRKERMVVSEVNVIKMHSVWLSYPISLPVLVLFMIHTFGQGAKKDISEDG